MQLKKSTLYKLSEMICGQTGVEPEPFPYRSRSDLERFFVACDVDDFYAGSRQSVVQSVLTKLNIEPTQLRAPLPNDSMTRVIQELLNPAYFERSGKDIEPALAALSTVLGKEGIEAYLDGDNTCQLRAGRVTTARAKPVTPGLSPRELARRASWERYLEQASEDAFTEKVLLPLLHHAGFHRLSAAGHKDKALEYGKDIWMKFELPTRQWIYFGVQVKKGKLDAAGRSKGTNENISEVLNQVRMALDTPVWDPDTNKRVLIDHVYLVVSGEITKAAKNLIGEKLDQASRRHILFMDRDDVLHLVAKSALPVPGEYLQGGVHLASDNSSLF